MKRTERMRPILLAAGAVLCAWLCGFSLSTLLERGGEMGKILGKLFPDITFAKAWGKKEGFDIKPNPASLNAMLKELNADKSQVVYVGDSNVDVFTAQNGQVGFIGCAWGFRGEQELLEELKK